VLVDSLQIVVLYKITLMKHEKSMLLSSYWLNAEGILAPRLYGSSGTCLDCGMSVDQVTTWCGIFSCIQQSFRYMFMTPCYLTGFSSLLCRSLVGWCYIRLCPDMRASNIEEGIRLADDAEEVAKQISNYFQ